MAVCSGITYNATTNRITCAWVSADGTKGNSFANGYNEQDIYDTAVAGSWPIIIALHDKQLECNAAIQGSGLSTYVNFNNVVFKISRGTSAINNYTRFYCNLKIYACVFDGDGGTYAVGNAFSFSPSVGATYDIDTITIKNFYTVSISEGTFNIKNLDIYECGQIIFGSASSTNVLISNCRIKGQLQPRGQGIVCERLLVEDSGVGILIGYSNFKYYNTEFKLCTKDINIYPVNTSIECLFVDSNINPTKIVFTSATTLYGQSITRLLSTFNAYIDNGIGAVLIIKDKDGNPVYSELLASENMTEKEIDYWRNEYKHDYGVVDYNNTYIYQPFSIVVVKEGFDTLVIPNINVTPGQPTIIRGTMVPTAPEPPSISSLQITNPGVSNNDGSITIIADSGTQPYLYSLNGREYQEDNVFENLEEGTYSVSVKDANNLTDTVAGIALKKTNPIIYYERRLEMKGITKQIPTAAFRAITKKLTLKKV